MGLRELVDCAMGRAPADLLIATGNGCAYGRDCAQHRQVKGSRIAYIGPDAGHTLGPNTRVIDAARRYLVPDCSTGTCVESGMVTVTEFVRAVIPHGTTGIY